MAFSLLKKMKEQIKNENEAVVDNGQEKESLMTIGEQRYEAIGKGLSRFGGMLSSWKEKAGSFLRIGAKKLAYGALATPDALARGTVATVEGIATGAEYVADKTVEGAKAAGHGIAVGAEYVADKTVEGAKAAGHGIAVGARYTAEGALIAGGVVAGGAMFVGEKIAEGAVATGHGITAGAEYMANKAVAAKDIVVANAELAADVAVFLKNQSVEGLKEVGSKINENYNKVVEYGEKVYNLNALRVEKVKNSFMQKFHSYMKNRYENKTLRNAEKWTNYSKKLEQYQAIESLAV